MFREWGFLLGEIWFLILLAALLGLLIGWLIWGRWGAEANAEADAALTARDDELARARAELAAREAQIADMEGEMGPLRAAAAEHSDITTQLAAAGVGVGGIAALAGLRGDNDEKDKRIAALEAQLRQAPSDLSGDLKAAKASVTERDARIQALETQLKAAPKDLSADLAACRKSGADKDARIAELEAQLAAGGAVDYDGDGKIEGVNEGVKPTTMAAPRAGGADDLKRIKGVGPKMEKLCNTLGFWHFDQIAAWSRDEVAWVDANLEGFKGRVTRDDWVAQAKLLAAGHETEFSKRVDDGDVY